MYYAVVYNLENPSTQTSANISSEDIEKLKAAFVRIQPDGTSKIVDTGGTPTHYRCRVFYPEIEPPERDPSREVLNSDEYWMKVLNLHTAIFPISGWIWSTPPANQTVWEVVFKQGGPSQGDFQSGWAYKCNDDSGMDRLMNNFGFGAIMGAVGAGLNALTGGGGTANNSNSAQNTHNSGTPSGNASTKFYHNKCVNGVLVSVEGKNPRGQIDPQLHQDRKNSLTTHARNLEPGNEQGDFKNKFSWFDWDTYTATLKNSESGGDQFAWEKQNKAGYIGWYQMGYDAIYDNGYFPGIDKNDYQKIRDQPGKRYSEERTSEFFYQTDWDSAEAQKIYTPAQRAKLKAAQDKAKSDPTFENKKEIANVWMGFADVQNNLMAKYTASRIQSLSDNELVDLSDVGQSQGLASAAHLGGVGRVSNKNDPNYENRNGVHEWVVLGQPPTQDKNGTKISSYYKTAQNNYNNKNSPCSNP
tara:strand:- start:1627 stop:3039 length:1413 start_codon:yes stop_codon:yes gene_type:complete